MTAASKRRSTPPRAKGLLEALETSSTEAPRTPEGNAEPVVLLWTDADSEWKSLLVRLRAVLPQVFTLGSYSPAERKGPAIWLRCIVDRTLAEANPPDGLVPILYLPGVAGRLCTASQDSSPA